MAIKTFINGQENGVITYLGDTEPCAVYVNGERQDNISYIPTLAEGEDSASYKSEYKNNLRTLQIEGNTEQEQGLPSAYQQVEYIESTDTQYIDTGFKPNQNTKVEIYGQQVKNLSNSLFGVNPLFVITSLNGKYAFRYNNTTFATSVSSLGIAKLVLDKNNAYVNDALVNTFSAGTFQSTYNACLFARASASGGVEEKGSSKIYYAKIWDNGTLIRDFIPCYRKSDNVIGLYDLVNGVFYTNAGTGTFLKGADVPTQIGGTTNPTIANPRAITNCGNGQIEVDVRSVNLIGKFKNFTRSKTDSDGNVLTWEMKDGIVTVNGMSNVFTTISVPFTSMDENPIIKAGTYTITPYFYREIGTIGVKGCDWNFQSGATSYTGTTGVIIKTFDNDVRFGHCMLYVSPNVQYTDYKFTPAILKGEYASLDALPPYEPYFNSTVSIPANVVLESGANETLLELAKIGDIADTITIDRVNNEVKYIQRICRVRPFVNVGGTLMYESYDSQYYNVDLWWFTLNKPAMFDVVGKCEFAKVDTITKTETDFCVEIGNTYMIIGIPKSLSINTPEALDSYLMQTGNFGLSIFYVLEEPIEWTITDNMESMGNTVNLKTNLLDWAKNTKNQTNIIEITSTPSVTKTSVNYAKWGGVPNENNT